MLESIACCVAELLGWREPLAGLLASGGDLFAWRAHSPAEHHSSRSTHATPQMLSRSAAGQRAGPAGVSRRDAGVSRPTCLAGCRNRHPGRQVAARGALPQPLPTPIKRGMALVCQLLHGAAGSMGGGDNGAGRADPLSMQQRHNMNGHAFIKVVGVGGGGGNAIARMINSGLQVGSRGG